MAIAVSQVVSELICRRECSASQTMIPGNSDYGAGLDNCSDPIQFSGCYFVQTRS